MSITKLSTAAVLAALIAMPAFAESVINITDPYARVATKHSKSGAAFMQIENIGDEADKLIGVRSDVAMRIELHTHIDAGDGVMQMRHIPEGFTISAGEAHMLQRGGDHVMLMGLNRTLQHGDMVQMILIFEKAGEITVDVPVDLKRKPKQGHGH